MTILETRSAAVEPAPRMLEAEWLAALTGELAVAGSPVAPQEILAAIRSLETLKCAAAGAQARLTVAYDDLLRASDEACGIPESRRGRAVVSDVAAARRESPSRGRQHVGMARALLEMPNCAYALSAGQISEWKAHLLVRETAVLTVEQRVAVDLSLADTMVTCPDKVLGQQARSLAYALDPAAFVKLHHRAVNERRVTIRAASDAMVHVSAMLPLVQGIAVVKALQDRADRVLAGGANPTTWPRGEDGAQPVESQTVRTRDQIMADELVELVTGRAVADPADIEVSLVMTSSGLLGDGTTAVDPAALLAGPEVVAELVADRTATVVVEGLDPMVIPVGVAKDALLVEQATVFLRRLFGAPGRLVTMESGRRHFTGLLRKFIVLRDQYCQTPWCAAPIRHIDHVEPVARHGPTDALNAQGSCAHCNLAKAEQQLR